jgi:hypothetical protein
MIHLLLLAHPLAAAPLAAVLRRALLSALVSCISHLTWTVLPGLFPQEAYTHSLPALLSETGQLQDVKAHTLMCPDSRLCVSLNPISLACCCERYGCVTTVTCWQHNTLKKNASPAHQQTTATYHSHNRKGNI